MSREERISRIDIEKIELEPLRVFIEEVLGFSNVSRNIPTRSGTPLIRKLSQGTQNRLSPNEFAEIMDYIGWVRDRIVAIQTFYSEKNNTLTRYRYDRKERN